MEVYKPICVMTILAAYFRASYYFGYKINKIFVGNFQKLICGCINSTKQSSLVKWGFYKMGSYGSFSFDEYGPTKVARMSRCSQNIDHLFCYLKLGYV